MINGGPTIRFECKKNKNRWQLLELTVDSEVTKHFGSEAFLPPKNQKFYPPWGHLSRIASILSKEGLDGGIIREEYSDRKYVGVIEVKRRKPKFVG